MKLIDVGFGTTGTRTIHKYLRERFEGVTCHGINCEAGIRCELGELYQITLKNQCVEKRIKESQCESHTLIEQFQESLIKSLELQIVAVSDTPYGYFISEYLQLVPSYQIIHSVRDPYTWVLQRLAEHPFGDLLCDPRIPHVAATVSTPFSILECLSISKYASDYLISMRDYLNITQQEAQRYVAMPRHEAETAMPPRTRQRLHDLMGSYVDFNWRILRTAQPRNNYVAVCVWDGDIGRDGVPNKKELQYSS